MEILDLGIYWIGEKVISVFPIWKIWKKPKLLFSQPNILEYFKKLNNFRNYMIFEIVKFWKFLEFSKLEIFGIFQVENFQNFPNCKFLEFFKLQIFGIFHIKNFWNCPNWKVIKFIFKKLIYKFYETKILIIKSVRINQSTWFSYLR